MKKIYLFIKRTVDIVLSLTGIILLSPILIVISLWIKVDSKGPVLFKQKRFGKNKKLFEIYKFRTMSIDTPDDVPTHLLKNPDSCITKSGLFLRKTSLDELPQLLNILTGDMTIIGPRPALHNQYDLIAERDKYNANSVTPGMGGWAQVHGRDELPISVKAKYDGEYVDNFGLMMDLKCFVKTFIAVIKTDGVKEGADL